VFVDEFNYSTTAAGDTGQRIICDDNGQAGLFHQQFVDVAQHGATAGQDDTAFRDIGTQLWRRLLQRFFHRANNTLQRFLQSFQDFIAVQGKASRYALREVATFDRDFENFLARERGTNFVLNALGCSFTNQDAIVAANVAEITATSDVPPPISSTMEPRAS